MVLLSCARGKIPWEVIKRVKKKIKEIEPGLPPGVKIVPFYDREGLIYRVIDTLREALIEEIIITSIVVAIFLLHVRSILICCLGFPISILISFLCMYFMGIDSNIMSLTGIAIAIGEVSDMSIIMTENIFRNLIEQKGKKSRPQIILDASKEVGGSIFFLCLNNYLYVLPGIWAYRPGREALYTTSLDKDHCYWVISYYGNYPGSHTLYLSDKG